MQVRIELSNRYPSLQGCEQAPSASMYGSSHLVHFLGLLQDEQCLGQAIHSPSNRIFYEVHGHTFLTGSKIVSSRQVSHESPSLHFRQFFAQGVHFILISSKKVPSLQGVQSPFSLANGALHVMHSSVVSHLSQFLGQLAHTFYSRW